MVHGPSQVVIVKFSSLPVADDLAILALDGAAFRAVAEALA
jgi:hypothetical protein